MVHVDLLIELHEAKLARFAKGQVEQVGLMAVLVRDKGEETPVEDERTGSGRIDAPPQPARVRTESSRCFVWEVRGGRHVASAAATRSGWLE